MRVDELKPAPGSHRARKRVGRGTGGKGGKTAGRGTKGQKARNKVAVGFEGGQMPMKQRVPKLRGFNNPFRVEYQGINLDVIDETGLDRGLARGAARARPHPQGSPDQGARAGRDQPRRDGQGPRVLPLG